MLGRISGIAFLFAWASYPATIRAQPAESGLSANLASDVIIPRGAIWRLFRGRGEPSGGSLEWARPEFDDRGWEAAQAGVGFSDGDDTTLLSDMAGAYSTVYLRRVFDVSDRFALSALALTIDYDDGFVAYLNGREVARSHAGPPGGTVPFDGVADASHEAGTPEVFHVLTAGLILSGANVLAVIGLNRDISSGDFSLHPALSSGAVLAEGCAGEFYVAGGKALLAGLSPIPSTHEVRVNGQLAAFDPLTGGWSFAASLEAAMTTFSAEAFDSDGRLLGELSLSATRASPLSGTLAAGTTLNASGSPYLVVGQVTVPTGRSLTVEAGCDVLFLPGSGFTIDGKVEGTGTAVAPIRFTRVPCRDNWGYFLLNAQSGPHHFRFCEWSHATGSPGCLTVSDSSLELSDCVIRDIDGEGVHATESLTRIRRCLTERTREALSLDRGDTVVEFCTVREATGKSDLIDCNGSTDPPSRIAFNHIYGTTDDGIDADGSSMVVEGNVIHDCGDQAMSLNGAGTSTVIRNLCYRNGNGLSVKDGHSCLADFNTFTLNTIAGVRAFEKTNGRGSGLITLKNSIVWGNVTQLFVDANGVINASFCDVEGMQANGPRNISVDPLFFDPGANDFQLQGASPCIGAAADSTDLGALPHGFKLGAPSDLEGTPALSGVTLSWWDNTSLEAGYEVERAEGDLAFKLLASLPADTRVYLDPIPPAGATYHYRVRSFNAHGSSDYSNVASVAIDGAPPPEIMSLAPGDGPTSGATPIVIRGRNFTSGATARLGGLILTDLQVVSREEIRAITPAGQRGSSDLTVTTEGGVAVLSAAFTYYDAYRRGDANGDGERDLSDVLFVLEYLFRGGPASTCPEAADTTADRNLDLTDAIFLLFFLFGDGTPPEPAEARCIE